MNYKNGWLILNRGCNLRCKWCYAKGTGYRAEEQMAPEKARAVIDLCAELHLRHLTLIGGEPTVYPHLTDVIRYAAGRGLRCAFVSNGVAYADEGYVRTLCDAGMRHFSISVKGTDRESFYKTTGADRYDDVLRGIENCLKADERTAVFLVLYEENIETFLGCVARLREMGVRKFNFSFLYHFDDTPGYKGYLERYRPRAVVRRFMQLYGELDRLTEGGIRITPTLPPCAWDADFLNMLAQKGQLAGGCQLKERSGLVIDYDGSLLPCNAMQSVRLGRFGVDFCDAESLLAYSKTPYVREIYDRLGAPPAKQCSGCTHERTCDACACQWTNYTLEQLLDT